VGAAHELQAHGRRLGTQHPGENPIEDLPAQITVAVALTEAK